MRPTRQVWFPAAIYEYILEAVQAMVVLVRCADAPEDFEISWRSPRRSCTGQPERTDAKLGPATACARLSHGGGVGEL